MTTQNTQAVTYQNDDDKCNEQKDEYHWVDDRQPVNLQHHYQQHTILPDTHCAKHTGVNY